MDERRIIIAIDGYSSTGKSTFARMIARTYGLLYLDSGALYRAVTLYAMECGFVRDGVLDADALSKALENLDVHFEYDASGTISTFIGRRNVEAQIRTLAVSGNVSEVSACAPVREYVDSILHRYGREGGIVMDGRDIGTQVFPEADLKIFMNADPLIRAQRRARELRLKGENCNEEEVLKNLRERDYIDSHRSVSPLRRSEDAIDLDNSDMTMQDQMKWIEPILEKEFSMLPVL